METKKQQHFDKTANKEIKAMDWLIKKLPNTSYKTVKSEYSPYDNLFTSGSTIYLNEVKVRKDYSSEQIRAFGGTILEFNKLNGIINYKNNNNDFSLIIYTVFYKDEAHIYNLIPDPNAYKWYPKWSPNNNYDKNKEWKMVTNLIDPIQIIKI